MSIGLNTKFKIGDTVKIISEAYPKIKGTFVEIESIRVEMYELDGRIMYEVFAGKPRKRYFIDEHHLELALEGSEHWSPKEQEVRKKMLEVIKILQKSAPVQMLGMAKEIYARMATRGKFSKQDATFLNKVWKQYGDK